MSVVGIVVQPRSSVTVEKSVNSVVIVETVVVEESDRCFCSDDRVVDVNGGGVEHGEDVTEPEFDGV